MRAGTVLTDIGEYRERDLPLDVMHLDIDYMQGYRVFTFDRKRFPDPLALTERLKRQGVKVIAIVDPGVKHQPAAANAARLATAKPELQPQDQRYYVFDQGLEKNYFQHRKNGELFIPKAWPGDSVFPDFTRAQTRDWWGTLYRDFSKMGVAGFWNDMNEPAVFDGPGKTMPLDNIHRIEEPGFATRNATHSEIHNIVGLENARATRRLWHVNSESVVTRMKANRGVG